MARFEWHDKKNDSNQKKHGLSFEDASQVFDDPDRIQYISDRGNEKRFLTVGKVIIPGTEWLGDIIAPPAMFSATRKT